MTRWLYVLAVVACVPQASAETLVAARVLRAQTIITEEDLQLEPSSIPGTLDSIQNAVGKETRVAIYTGQPIRPENVGPPAIVDKNQRIQIAYHKGGLIIVAEGRAMNRGGVGDTIRVMNSVSKATIFATIEEDGTAYVQPQ